MRVIVTEEKLEETEAKLVAAKAELKAKGIDPIKVKVKLE
jgi:hypothetical protein